MANFQYPIEDTNANGSNSSPNGHRIVDNEKNDSLHKFNEESQHGSFYIPNIKLIGYGRSQTYQNVCMKCGELFFCFNQNRSIKDLFCDWCDVNEGLITEENIAIKNYLGNIVGWEVKSETRFKGRSRYNYKKCYQRDRYTCQYCGFSPGQFMEFRPLHIDHLIPWSSCGSNGLDNLVTCCELCNAIACNKYFQNFRDKKDYVLSRIKHKILNLRLCNEYRGFIEI